MLSKISNLRPKTSTATVGACSTILVALVRERGGSSNKGLHQTKRVGVPASRAVVEARFAGEGRCSTGRSETGQNVGWYRS